MRKVVPFERDNAYLIDRAALNRRQGHLLDALSLYRRALENAPDEAQVAMDMAETLCEMGCYEQSARALCAMLVRPDAPQDCYFGLCCNYFGMNDLDAAYRAMVRFLAAEPDAVKRPEVSEMLKNIVLLRTLTQSDDRRKARRAKLLEAARRRLMAGDAPSAERLLRRSMRMGATEGTHVLLAEAHLAQNRIGEARREIESVLKKPKVTAQALLTGVRVYNASGDTKRRSAALTRLGRMDGDNQALRARVEALFLVGADQALTALLRAALRDAPNERMLLHALAVNNLRLGKPVSRAAACWSRMLRIDPEDDVAAYYYTRCYHGEPPLDAAYACALPEAEIQKRTNRLLSLQTAPDDSIDDEDVLALCRWGLRSGDKRAAILARALLERADDPDARALCREADVERDIARADGPNLRVRSGPGAAAVAVWDAGGSYRLPPAMRRAIRLVMTRGKALLNDTGESPVAMTMTSVVNKSARRITDENAWAAALVYAARVKDGKSADTLEIARRFGCSPRKMRRYARRLTGGERP